MSLEIQNGSVINIDTILNDSKSYEINSVEIYNEEIYNEDIYNEERIYQEEKDNELPILIYRFKFTEVFMEQLYNFSKIHQYDERKDFIIYTTSTLVS